MALVRVYCGLASAEPARPAEQAGTWLTVAVVDDSGRLLDVRDIGDDPAGYAQLGALLAERASGPTGVSIAADSDDHLVTMLLTAAGRPLAFADDDLVDDFAERFSDDESIEEMESPEAERRAIGLARALQAGALSAVALPAPREMAALKPVLNAHAAVAVGRQAAAVALREVLRELYPAALRAYPDPAEPVPLAVLDALPEPGLVGGAAGRGRDAVPAADAIVNQLVASGVADPAGLSEAITALRVAIAETPRRGTVSRSLSSAVATTIRHAVAAVRACDAAGAALIGALADRANPPVEASRPRVLRQRAAPAPSSVPPAVTLRSVREGTAEHATVRVPLPRRNRPNSAPISPAAAAALAAGSGPASSSPASSSPASSAAAAVPPGASSPPAAFGPAAAARAASAVSAPPAGYASAPPAGYASAPPAGYASAPPAPTPMPSRRPSLTSPAATAAPAPPPATASPAPVPLAPVSPTHRPASAPPLPSADPSWADPSWSVDPPWLAHDDQTGRAVPPPPPGIPPIAPAPVSPIRPGRPAAYQPEPATYPAEPYGPPVAPYGFPAVPAHPSSAPPAPGPAPYLAPGAGPHAVPTPAAFPVPAPAASYPPPSPGPAYPPDQFGSEPVSAPAYRPVPQVPTRVPRAAEAFRTTVTTTSGDLRVPGVAEYAPLQSPAEPPPPAAPPGSRANWPLAGHSDDGGPEPLMAGLAPDPILGDPYADLTLPPWPEERVTPPWQADDLPEPPPMLRLVEPPPLADPVLRTGDELGNGVRFDPPALRLVETDSSVRGDRGAGGGGSRGRRLEVAPVSVPPVDEDGDADLLIFAATRSAWFTGHGQEDDPEWASLADDGWRAAEQAARPTVGTATTAGLPKRVPQANLVPGSPLSDDRPLRIVRDPASIAAHTSGYFRGWRRGQEINGYAVGGRPGRESAQGWDFTRDPGGPEYDDDYEYRAAGYQSR